MLEHLPYVDESCDEEEDHGDGGCCQRWVVVVGLEFSGRFGLCHGCSDAKRVFKKECVEE
jgi:hypothetical protein